MFSGLAWVGQDSDKSKGPGGWVPWALETLYTHGIHMYNSIASRSMIYLLMVFHKYNPV